jgi:hypothetical protein
VAWSLFAIFGFCIIVVVAVSFTIQTSRGDNPILKIAKFFGMCISLVPIIGLILYLSTKGRPSGYGEKCGAMALIGIVWYTVTQAGRRAFLPH